MLVRGENMFQGKSLFCVSLGVLFCAHAGCHTLWSPFLGDNPECAQDPSRCTSSQGDASVYAEDSGGSQQDLKITPSDLSANDGSTDRADFGTKPLDMTALPDLAPLPKTWKKQVSGVAKTLYSVYALSPSEVWAVGELGTALSWDNSAQVWTSKGTGNTGHTLYGIWGVSATSLWAVGSPSLILKWNGSWTPESSPTDVDFRGIWGLQSGAIWAVGASGKMAKFDGTTWNEDILPTPAFNINHIRGINASLVWAVGANGRVAKWNGIQWIHDGSLNASHTMYGVVGVSSTDAWVVGETNARWRWNGTGWSQDSNAPQGSLFAIWGARRPRPATR